MPVPENTGPRLVRSAYGVPIAVQSDVGRANYQAMNGTVKEVVTKGGIYYDGVATGLGLCGRVVERGQNLGRGKREVVYLYLVV